VAVATAANLFHYGIFVRGRPVEAAWTVAFRVRPVEKPHKIWLKMLSTRRRLVYDTHKLSTYTAQNFKEDSRMATGMTKTQLVRLMAEKNELNNKQAAAFLESLAEVAIKETKKNGLFVVPGLGRLVKSNRKARMGRNPQTGEAIKIAAKTVVKFRVAKAAKDAIAPKK
jgi:DNA-binding protein HU-beta